MNYSGFSQAGLNQNNGVSGRHEKKGKENEFVDKKKPSFLNKLGFWKWCREKDLNLHGVTPTST
jgi:hypothetical protein